MTLWLAIAGRLRGSDLTIGSLVVNDSEKRYIIWGGTVAIAILLATHNILWAWAALPLAGIGASVGYWGEFNLNDPANRNWKNYAILTAVGCFRFLPLLVGSYFIGQEWHILPAVIAGFSFVPIYLFCNKYFQTFTLGHFLSGWTEWAELIFWGTLGLGLELGMRW